MPDTPYIEKNEPLTDWSKPIEGNQQMSNYILEDLDKLQKGEKAYFRFPNLTFIENDPALKKKIFEKLDDGVSLTFIVKSTIPEEIIKEYRKRGAKITKLEPECLEPIFYE